MLTPSRLALPLPICPFLSLSLPSLPICHLLMVGREFLREPWACLLFLTFMLLFRSQLGVVRSGVATPVVRSQVSSSS